jgi:hypothetical protein
MMTAANSVWISMVKERIDEPVVKERLLDEPKERLLDEPKESPLDKC